MDLRLYKTPEGIIIEKEGKLHLAILEDWDSFLNADNLYEKALQLANTLPVANESLLAEMQTPIGNQELWACGVTYLRSKVGRQEESKAAGGGDFYAKVYEAERPEVFFKATPNRIVGHNQQVRIRKDSTWDVPEPELTLVVNSKGTIVGYTIGNDMSSRSIEGENPLYLPQAKTYDGCAAIGPCVYISNKPIDMNTKISIQINRAGSAIFEESIAINQIKRSLEELVEFVYRECSFPNGCLIMTGTGIVPDNDFTLKCGDEIIITIDHIGTLRNVVE